MRTRFLLLLSCLAQVIPLLSLPVRTSVSSLADVAEEFDVCPVGLGTAGVSVLASVLREFPKLRVVVLEFGGPLSGRFGGTDYFGQYMPSGSIQGRPGSSTDKLTVFDVPGTAAHTSQTLTMLHSVYAGMYETISRNKTYADESFVCLPLTPLELVLIGTRLAHLISLFKARVLEAIQSSTGCCT